MGAVFSKEFIGFVLPGRVKRGSLSRVVGTQERLP